MNGLENRKYKFGRFLLTSILTIAAAQIANVVDAALVGNILGDTALAAVNVCRPVLQFLFAMAVLVVTGGSILVGMEIGKGDRRAADRIFSVTLGLAVLFPAVAAGTGAIFIEPLLSLLCGSESVLPLAGKFLRVVLLSAVPMVLMTVLDSFVTVEGALRRAVVSVIVGNAVNLTLDVVFMKFLGMGIGGAALATLIMYIVSITVLLPHFGRPGNLRLSISLGRRDTIRILKHGFPLFCSSVLASVQFACCNTVCSEYFGDAGLVACAVCVQMLFFSMIFLNGTYRTVQPLGSVFKGSGDNDGVRKVVKKSFIFLAVSLAVLVLLVNLFPDRIVSIFGVKNQENVRVAVSVLPAYSLQIFLFGIISNLVPVYQIYSRNALAMSVAIMENTLPLLCFWAFSHLASRGVPVNPWLGFAAGTAVSMLVLSVITSSVRQKDASLSPVTLLPGE